MSAKTGEQAARGVHKRLYRIYYTEFNDEAHLRVLSALRERYGVEPREIRSVVAPEFRFVELPLEKPGLEPELQDLVRSITGSSYVKVDWIDTGA